MKVNKSSFYGENSMPTFDRNFYIKSHHAKTKLKTHPVGMIFVRGGSCCEKTKIKIICLRTRKKIIRILVTLPPKFRMWLLG